MQRYIVLKAPQRLEGGYGDQDLAARLQHAGDLRQRPVIVIDMLNDVCCEHEVELRIAKGGIQMPFLT